jgi:hypothetical protein
MTASLPARYALEFLERYEAHRQSREDQVVELLERNTPAAAGTQVRNTLCRPRSWANSSLL